MVLLKSGSLGVVGVDASAGAAAEEVLTLTDAALAEAGLSAASVASLAMVDAQAGEPGIQQAAQERGWPLGTHPASRPGIATAQRRRAEARVTTASVAEAAALVGACELVVPELTSASASVAVARAWPRGRLALVGTGPGARDLLSPVPPASFAARRWWSAWARPLTR